MNRPFVLLILLWVFTAATAAQAQKAKLTPGQEHYRAALKNLVAERQALVRQFQAATTFDEKLKIRRQIVALMIQFSDRFLKVAADHPKDPGAEEALAQAATLLEVDETAEAQGAKALALLVAEFPQSKRIGPALQWARSASTPELDKPLRQIMKVHADPEVQSRACLVLAENLRRRHELAFQKNPTEPGGLLQEAGKLLRFGQAAYRNTNSADEYVVALFALEHLTAGMRPPAIDGEDVVTGKPLRLSDFKGKVVLLCFWGNWSPPCRDLFPQQRALAKRLGGKPFTLLGVNSDKDREKTRTVIAKEQLAWPHFWNGGGRDGPIAKRYGVRVWPTIYVLDADGVIRVRNVTGPALDEAIDRLLKEQGG
ncbi:MAG: TlpA family protein disulfide reductase [Gemmataceae bacterium]|nr:TlpA family protein disulfide reductase [Gemmataceae bacterium]